MQLLTFPFFRHRSFIHTFVILEDRLSLRAKFVCQFVMGMN